ncbi:AMP-binding protein [Ekhidna sp.]
MIIRSNNFVLKLEEILKDSLPTERYNEHENIVLNIIRSWFSNAKSFTHHSSGSTGRPKKIEISREKIEISTKATLDFIDPDNAVRSSLLCLDPSHIGGAMVVYRAMIANHDLYIIEPTSNIISIIGASSFDLVSMVPLQFKALTNSQIDQFGKILIGGAPMDSKNVKTSATIYSTFGMTETVSHIALRSLSEDVFTTTGDTIVRINQDDTLEIKGSITDAKWLKTNDIVEVINQKTFKWIGRKDFIINTGGIKVNPEEIEQVLNDQMNDDFIICSLLDSSLNRKIILVSSGPEKELDFSNLKKYHVPKELYFDQVIFKTPSGKLDRLKTQKVLEDSL